MLALAGHKPRPDRGFKGAHLPGGCPQNLCESLWISPAIAWQPLDATTTFFESVARGATSVIRSLRERNAIAVFASGMSLETASRPTTNFDAAEPEAGDSVANSPARPYLKSPCVNTAASRLKKSF